VRHWQSAGKYTEIAAHENPARIILVKEEVHDIAGEFLVRIGVQLGGTGNNVDKVRYPVRRNHEPGVLRIVPNETIVKSGNGPLRHRRTVSIWIEKL
jgi:hypothetical protein